MAKIGDIVTRNYAGINRRYTVRSFVPNYGGTRDVDLVGKFHIDGAPTHTHAFQRNEAQVVVDESPVFTVAQRVQVGDRWGAVISDGGNDVVPVMLEEEDKMTLGGQKLTIDPARVDVPRWLLVLENILP